VRSLLRLLPALTLALAACTGTSEEAARTPSPTPSATVTTAPPPTTASASPTSAGTASPTATATASPTPQQPVNPVSIAALAAKKYDGRDLRLGRVLVSTDAYTQRFVTYRSGRLTVSGTLAVPRGAGPFPVLVLAHGYIDPAVYVNGQGLRREQEYLASRGYVVLHVDYRNHAASDNDPGEEMRLRLGYSEDVINAVLAVRASSLPSVDRDRVGLLGRSMGGGVVYNVLAAQPGLVDAAVVFAPVSSDAGDNFNRWIRNDGPTGARIIARYGAPEDNPAFWRDASARTYFDRVTEPLLIHHGTSDDSCPIAWSRETVAALERAGKDVRLNVYNGEEHAFGPQWPLSMRRTTAFFEQNLRA
jgi:dipeptidyl aminopeptidase/acylaminoacyl peptidase